MTFHVATALTKLGTKLTGAGDCVSVEEAISTLDRVRRAAVTAREDELKKSKPPLLFTDSLIPNDLFLLSSARDCNFMHGKKKFNIKGLRVVGGAIYESKRCKFAVSILYSDQERTVLMNSCGTPFADLELEFYDYAFEEDKMWLNLVMDASNIKEHSQWHKEACLARKAGMQNTPQFLLNTDDYTLLRAGVTPFMCLRSPKDEVEHNSVIAAVQSDLRLFPAGSKQMMLDVSKCNSVWMGFRGCTSIEVDVPREVSPTSADERREKATELVSYAVLTFIANIILKNAYDDGFDEQEQKIAESRTGIQHRPNHDQVMREVEAEEAAFVMASKSKKVTELEAHQNVPHPHLAEFTLTSVFKNTDRVYTCKSLCENSQAMDVMSAVAREIFHESDVRTVEDKCARLISTSTTTTTAVATLGKFVDPHFALVLISREIDGRILNAKLISTNVVITSINLDALKRLMTYTWTRIVVIDKEQVSILLCRDPEYTSKAVSFDKEKFTMAEDAKCGGNSRVYSSNMEETRPKIDDLVAQVQALKSANEATLAAVNEFKRKLDFIVEQKAEEDDSPPDPKSDSPLNLSPARPLPPTDSSSILDELKGTFNKLVNFEKRARYKPAD